MRGLLQIFIEQYNNIDKIKQPTLAVLYKNLLDSLQSDLDVIDDLTDRINMIIDTELIDRRQRLVLSADELVNKLWTLSRKIQK